MKRKVGCKRQAWCIVAQLGRAVQVKKRGGGNSLIWAQRERNLFKPWWNEIERGEEQKEREQKETVSTSRTKHTIQTMLEARQHHNGNECGSRFMLGSQRSYCHNKTNSGFTDSSESVGRKGKMSSTTDRYRVGILDGHRDRQVMRLRLPRHSHSGW